LVGFFGDDALQTSEPFIFGNINRQNEVGDWARHAAALLTGRGDLDWK